ASDGKGSTAVQAITVTVTNVNEAVSMTSNGAAATATVSVAENQVAVTTVSASDIDGDTPSFAITGGDDASKFTIDSVTGVLTFIAAPDFEAPVDADANNTYLVNVTASDGKGSTDVQAITVTVTNVNEGMSITSNGGGATAAVNAAENQGSVTTVTALDIDGDTPSFAITGGADQAKFSIDPATGMLTFISNPNFESPTDSDGNNTYLVTVTASDGKGSTVSQAITVTVTDVNEAVSITSNGAGATASVSAAENQPGVTTVTATDIDGDTPSFSITGGADQAKFAINAVTGVLTFIANPNFEAPTDSDGNNTYVVNVTAGDGKGNTAVQAITVTVTNVNEVVSITSNGAGATAAVGAAENQVGVATVAASDIDGDTPTFAITGGADQAKFAINGATGVLTFIASPNFEAPTDSDGNNTYLVNVTASDGKGSTASQAITVTVTNVNEAPVITSNGAGAAAAISMAENQVAVTTVTAADADGGALVFSISGGADQTKFVINGATGALSFKAAPNFEIPSDTGANNTYVVDVTVVDGNGSTDVQAITATVINVNDKPVITSNGGGTTAAIGVTENETAVTTVTATDADGTLPTFSITGGADQAKFSINPVTGVLTFIAAPDFNAPTDNGGDNTYVVAVTAGDGAGGVAEQTITVSILDIDASPQLQSPPAALSTGGDGIAPADSDDSVLVYIVNSLNVDDVIDGGGGFDTLQISAPQNVVLGPSTLINFEALIVTSGIQYITSSDATVGAGKTLLVDASASAAALTWNGAAETDGAFRLLGGSASDTFVGGAGADIISAFDGDDVIAGNAGNDIISGGLGNDTVSAGPGNDKVDGGGGKDILVLAGAGRGDYTMRLDQGQLLLTERTASTDGADLVANIETLRFAGGGGVSADLDFNLSDVAALVRLYDVLFNRRPDEAGINFWIGASEGGYKMHQIAQWFAASSELQATYGLLSDDAFVGLLYQNGLHRAASTGEVSQWTQLLTNGSADRGDVLLAVANSAEVIELIGPITTSIPTL
ncbi:MAG: cadherin domain-containing protein, partial [Massilia sp.]|nr:cadherin domain-containing protein [Massilia sp.]